MATPTQILVLGYLVDYQSKNGFVPSRREISNHFGWVSANSAHEHLMRLQDGGYIEIAEGKSRGIKINMEKALGAVRESRP